MGMVTVMLVNQSRNNLFGLRYNTDDALPTYFGLKGKQLKTIYAVSLLNANTIYYADMSWEKHQIVNADIPAIASNYDTKFEFFERIPFNYLTHVEDTTFNPYRVPVWFVNLYMYFAARVSILRHATMKMYTHNKIAQSWTSTIFEKIVNTSSSEPFDYHFEKFPTRILEMLIPILLTPNRYNKLGDSVPDEVSKQLLLVFRALNIKDRNTPNKNTVYSRRTINRIKRKYRTLWNQGAEVMELPVQWVGELA